MKIVLDTNVLVSGLLTPFGPSGKIVRMVSAGRLILQIDARILSEYQEVLHRPKFKFNKDHIGTLLDFIKQYGQFVSSLPLKKHLPDPDDEPFLEVAIAGKAMSLITGNGAHYPTSSREGINILSPSEFLKFYEKADGLTVEPVE
ncbi:MAG: putative toxin-antitoxin system toxin component, PIN family [Proteobacteria bacterium]|jgi:putative PIN family toxin of toxin-antitoxin system|nr:putative toxin-antitoxin system toxin component, PIN family [Desulfobacterales bacterium]MBU0735056.1 putative toxin-antitoxin system toxin component, PIN family [Pseudomonadota bacterium]MBU1902847.1 putative toxin-antitoxin system toxin component, PIN family [Pseudomonadota bacterium]